MWRKFYTFPNRIHQSIFERLNSAQYQFESCSHALFGSSALVKHYGYQLPSLIRTWPNISYTTQTGPPDHNNDHEVTKDPHIGIGPPNTPGTYTIPESKELAETFTQLVGARSMILGSFASNDEAEVENDTLDAKWQSNDEKQHIAYCNAHAKSTLPQVLTSHILNVANANLQDSNADEKLLQVYDERTSRILDQRGYSIKDIGTWTWILMSRNADEAIDKLIQLNSTDNLTWIPSFLLLFILGGRSISPRSLKFVVDKVKANLTFRADLADPQLDLRSLRFRIEFEHPASMLLLYIKLVRHCRRVWAQGLCDIAEIFTLMFPARPLQLQWQRNNDLEGLHRLSFYYNRALVLLSRPAFQNPFENVTIQHRALIRVLRTMTQFKPHIPVNREGFRALLSVQLGQKKTKLEREWADLKSLAWPPWKEDKSGLDTDRGDIGGDSRALRVIRQMNDAGYSKRELENIATVYAGWDTDGSPTIQVRKSIALAEQDRASISDGNDSAYMNELWAARIATTRTLREAWSAFLSFEKDVSHHRLRPYSKMLQKLLYPPSQNPDHSKSVHAGDAKETIAEPLSPRYLTYVPSDPPTIKSFLERMTKRGLKPEGRLLALLIVQSSSFSQAFKYIATAYPALAENPNHLAANLARKDFWSCIQSLRPPMLTAYLQTISRFPCGFVRLITNPEVDLKPYVPPKFLASLRQQLPDGPSDPRIAIHFMVLIVRNYRPALAPMWHSLLIAFKKIFLYTLRGNDTAQPLAADAWFYLNFIQRSMEESGVSCTFQEYDELCFIWEAFFLSGASISNASVDSVRPMSRLYFKYPHPLGLQCKVYFERLVLPMNHTIFTASKENRAQSDLSSSSNIVARPALLNIPSFHTLHLLIQVLGARNDHTGLVSLLEWMRAYAPDLDKRLAETNNGPRLRRLAITAMRLFVEKRIDGPPHEPSLKRGAQNAEWAKQIVNSVESWGGWPSSEEVQRYVAYRPKFKTLKKRYNYS